MKTFLIALCILNILKNLKAVPASELLSGVYSDSQLNDGCNKQLQTEIESIRNILDIKCPDGAFGTEKPILTADDLSQLKSDIKGLNKTIEKNNDLIKTHTGFIDSKFSTIENHVSMLKEKVDAQITNNAMLKNNLEKLTQELTADHAESNSTGYNGLLRHFRRLEEKLERKEKELKYLIVENEHFSGVVIHLIHDLQNQLSKMKEQIVAIDQYESLTNYLKSFNETLNEHLGKHADKLNEHENLLKVIMEENSKTQTQTGTQCSKCEKNEELIEMLITRFDEMRPLWKKLENSTTNDDKCTDFEGFDIDLRIVDEN